MIQYPLSLKPEASLFALSRPKRGNCYSRDSTQNTTSILYRQVYFRLFCVTLFEAHRI